MVLSQRYGRKMSLLTTFVGLFGVLAAVSASDDNANNDDGIMTSYEILLRLYDATRGLRWTDHTGWLSNDDICTWQGITCFDNDDVQRGGHIQAIDLSDNHLVGTLPTEVFDLPYLETLVLSDNTNLEIKFLVQDNGGHHDLVQNLGATLKHLRLSKTNIVSLEGISTAVNLETLQIEHAQLTGRMPRELFALTQLSGLFASYNAFTGTLPTAIGNLAATLQQFFAFDNELVGQLPTELGLLSNLKILTLGQNKFNGTLPAELNDCTNLERLAIQQDDDNPKSLGMTGPLPALSDLKHLTEIFLQNQRFSGSIPTTFLQSAPKDEIVRLDLSDNALTGAVPESWIDFHRLRPLLKNNQLDDLSSDLCMTAENWFSDKASCPDSILCPPGTYAPKEGRATVDKPCVPCDGAPYYGMDFCIHMDGLAATAESERDILELLYRKTGGADWFANTNWLSEGDIPVCQWYGVECNADGKVNGIRMRNNKLRNSLPTEIFALPDLMDLDLNSNDISFSFEGISKATNLEVLDLTSTELESLDGIAGLEGTKIRKLKLSSNHIKGEIPLALFQLTTLVEINLSHNEFTGRLPSSVGSLGDKLERFSCYGNVLEGPLPSELGELVNLIQLNLSENSFTGSLPTEMEKMTSLKSMTIHQTSSTEGLTGSLLAFEDLTQLTSLHMEANKLSGPLPARFLANTAHGASRIEIRLHDNAIDGIVPSEWADRFENLFLDLTGNHIIGLRGEWCNKEDWMDGGVSEFECDAILCPAGTYNEFGRRPHSDTVCQDCPGGGNWLGARTCGDTNSAQESELTPTLNEFYYAAGGASWNDNTGWTKASDVCTGWKGISCNGDGEIIKIQLKDNGLTGSLASSIFTLPSLKHLDLGGNLQLSVSLDGIEKAKELLILSLNNVHMDSMDGISKATSLQELHVAQNELTGSISDEVLELSQLSILGMTFNRFSGRIPNNISKLSKLEALYLDGNKLSGQIPAAIGGLKKLKILSLSENQLTGTLPNELNDLFHLEELMIHAESGVSSVDDGSSGALVGAGIRGPLPSFRDLPHLRMLVLSENSLTGAIPFDFLDGLVDKSNEIYVDISSNELLGRVPASMTQFEKMNLYAVGNKFTDIAPGLCKKEGWMEGLVKEYGCNAILCPPSTFNQFGFEMSKPKHSPCEECTAEGAASFYGSQACLTVTEVAATEEGEILKELFEATGGSNWKDSAYWLDDSASICSWFGVDCVSDDIESVQALHLPTNGLNGTIPVSIFSLKSLTEIDFSGNTVKILFQDVEAASAVTYINLDHTGTVSIKGIAEAAPNLKALHIQTNNFYELPSQIFYLTLLESLYMSNNAFDGEFPTGLDTLENLVFLACNDCGFSGTLPHSIGYLENLVLLSLFGNSMTGTIPTQLMQITSLKGLDLAVQTNRGGEGFSGTIPDFAGMENLVDVMLSWNSLTGSIPPTLLGNVSGTEHMTLDFRNNLLTGAIPTELSKFTHVDFLMANNNIDSVPQVICDLPWNVGAAGLPADAGCDHVLCAKGSFSSIGYASITSKCIACSQGLTQYFGNTQCGEDPERDILSAFFVDLNGTDWASQHGWLTNDDVCTWYGLTCYDEGAAKGHVREIALSENNLKGTVSSTIFNLEYLESVDFKANEVVLPFEGIGNAKSLISLQLSNTPVQSIDGIANATDLIYLHLTDCNMTGTIPAELFDMASLQGLFMNYNHFEGTLSTKIANLAELRELYIFENELSGSLPSELGLLTNIYILGLGENKMTGTLPTELNLLTNMQILSLQQETGIGANGVSFDGEFGIGLSGNLLPFDALHSLRELYLGKNSFQGSIPNNFLSSVNNLTRTLKVDITDNNLVGSIPVEFARFDDLRLYAAGNMIDSVPEELCDKKGWMKGLMSSGCDALLCAPGYYSEFGRRTSNSQVCEPCIFTVSTAYYGSESCVAQEGDDLDERSILFQIYHELEGSSWSNKDNWLEDNRSICLWHGVHCASEDSSTAPETVVRLELPSNGLKGTVPASVYHLSSLKVLNIRGNDAILSFHGAEATTTLEELSIDGTATESLKGIGKIKSLKILHIEDNDFGGDVVPDDLFSLSNLELLDLSDSGFGGKLSEKIGQLTNLKQLFCHKNELSGTLPKSLGMLNKLEVLQLSENTLVGTLPSEMESMTSLKSFFIDSFTRNGAGISGPLLSFSNMPQLRDIFIGSQTLTGTIPADFLAGINDAGATVNIGLKSNSLTGTVPGDLSVLSRLNIDVTDNLFEGIDESLCGKSKWMGGAVGLYGCDSIMCNKGTFNDVGRQTSDTNPCMACDGGDEVPYLGSVTCLPVQQKKERQILELLYQVTDGANWKNNDGWLDESIGICKWHGISCKDDQTVASVVLGSNNLSGRPPKQLFELSNLHFLWLYSNPIDFSFEGIEKAKKLTSLLLDSTGLKSIEGVEKAQSLSDIDIRFNSLTGTLPPLRNLHELASLSVGHNKFSGSIPSYTNNRKLRTLRLGDNDFTGTIPSFAFHELLASIDLSGNKLTGTIPVNMLQSVESDSKIFIDLSSNQLTGTVPGDFTEHHDKVTIYLRDNKLSGIDENLCSAEEYNDGDVLEYGCEGILCQPGTYAAGNGRASLEGTQCVPCPQNLYFGSSTCIEASAATSYLSFAWLLPYLTATLAVVLI